MHDITWLEELATTTHYDIAFDKILNAQPFDIRLAYIQNNPDKLRNLLGNDKQLPHKQSIFITFT